MGDIVVYPHCDLHMAVGGSPTPPLRLRVRWREPGPDRTGFQLWDITSECRFDFFAPYRPPGQRLRDLPTVDPSTGLVTGGQPGIYLFQVLHQDDGTYHHQVGRLQVHEDVLDWWFGHTSITTALDPVVAHAQPTIFASFSEDLATGTDIVGDITGHGYVSLSSTDPTQFTVDSDGRLRGMAHTPPSGAVLVGDFLGPPQHLSVHVVDYRSARSDLKRVPSARGDGPPTHHLLLLPEGFRDTPADRARFERTTHRIVDELSTKPRHSPLDLLLEGDIAVWSAFAPSRDQALTYGFQVTDSAVDGVLPAGAPIPYVGFLPFAEGPRPTMPYRKYLVSELVARVGLPPRGENRDRDQLVALWSSPEAALSDFEPARVDEPLVEAWKAQTFSAVLTQRDTVFGFRIGGRLGDRLSSATGNAVVPPDPGLPDRDTPTRPELQPFVARVYEFFAVMGARSVMPDPRRHPPELLARWNDPAPGTSIMRYVASLHTADGENLGPVWVPEWRNDDWAVKPSLGLVAFVCDDEHHGGTSIGGNTAVGASAGLRRAVRYTDSIAGNRRRRERVVGPSPAELGEFGELVDTVAHELGHNLGLGDEYETLRGDDPGEAANPGRDDAFDNTTGLAGIHASPPVAGPDGQPRFLSKSIRPDHVKWLLLLRPRVSSALMSPSEAVPDGIRLTIDRRYLEMWKAARADKAFLQRPTGGRRQLPLVEAASHRLTDRPIVRIEEETGAVVIAGPAPASPFPAGSLLFVPYRRPDPAGGTDLVYVTERRVLARLRATGLPLNADPDVSEYMMTDVDLPDFGVLAPLDLPLMLPYKLIGVYEGAANWAGSHYRPAGACKMRDQHGEFCHVCQYLIVNRINPSLLAKLDAQRYPFRGLDLD